jgi:hypothetical protein
MDCRGEVKVKWSQAGYVIFLAVWLRKQSASYISHVLYYKFVVLPTTLEVSQNDKLMALRM